MKERKAIKWKKVEDRHELVDPEQIREVEGRVGSTPAQRLQWALDFARKDLGGLTEGDWLNLRRELVAFDGWVIPHSQVRNKRVRRSPTDRGHPVPAWLTGRIPLPTEEEIRGVQTAMRHIVETLLTTGEVFISRIQASFVILRDPNGRSGYFGRVPPVGSWGALTLAELLGGFAPLVRVCRDPACKRRWFVASRANQWYCSAACQSRTTTREYRMRKANQRPKRG